MKPALIWVSIAGHIFTTSNGQSHSELFASLLYNSLTTDERLNPETLTEQDFALCRVLDLRCIKGVSWDDRRALVHLLNTDRIAEVSSLSPKSRQDSMKQNICY